MNTTRFAKLLDSTSPWGSLLLIDKEVRKLLTEEVTEGQRKDLTILRATLTNRVNTYSSFKTDKEELWDFVTNTACSLDEEYPAKGV